MRKNLFSIVYTVAVVMMVYNLVFQIIRSNQRTESRELRKLESEIKKLSKNNENAEDLSILTKKITAINDTRNNYNTLFYVNMIGAPLMLIIASLIKQYTKNEEKRIAFESSQIGNSPK